MSPVAGAAGIDLGGTMGNAAPVRGATPPPGPGTGYPPGNQPPIQTPTQPPVTPPGQPATQPSGQQLPFNLPPALRPVAPGSPAAGTGAPAAPGGGMPAPGAGTPFAGGTAVKAQVGVAKRGRSLDGMEGVLVTPAKSLFAFQERAIFEIQLPQAMQLFQGTNGRKPNSHDEYMAAIVKANNIKLPELPEGQQYRYYPEKGELMVLRPRQ